MKGTEKMQNWKAHYKDALHDADIIMINTEEDYAADPLSFTLDGVTFRGASISSFQLADETQYEEAKEKCNLWCRIFLFMWTEPVMKAVVRPCGLKRRSRISAPG